MKKLNKQLAICILTLVTCVLVLSLTGCKEEPEPVTVSDTGEQTMCPVMEGKIDKDIFVEYKGKKVYFCCAGCDEKFQADPEKYLSKLPQFNTSE